VVRVGRCRRYGFGCRRQWRARWPELEYRALSLLSRRVAVCPRAGVRYDLGMESAADFGLGLDVEVPMRRTAIAGGFNVVYQRYSLRRDRYAKGVEWFGSAELGIAVRVSDRSWISPVLRYFFDYGFGRRPSLVVRWSWLR